MLPPLHLGGYTSKIFILLVLFQGCLSSFFVLPSSVQEHFFLFACPLAVFFGLIPNCLGPVPSALWLLVHGLFPKLVILRFVNSFDGCLNLFRNFPSLLPLRLCLFCCLFLFPPTGVKCPGSWIISHDLTPDLIFALGRWQVFLVIWFCVNEVGSTIK